jgi:hypothetical protein
VTKSQAGFRAGYSTQDNIFILYSLITLYLSKKKKLFCCFIDFTKAFENKEDQRHFGGKFLKNQQGWPRSHYYLTL